MAEYTFLFADLVGFTTLTDRDGDERAADVALGLYARARKLLPRYTAEEVKTLGDGVVLRCDHPAEAIDLGLRLVEELEGEPDFPSVRVGVHTGSAVRRQGDWYGRAVNVAARLCTAAAGGEVLVSETTLRSAGELRKLELSERRLHWLRNVTEPVAARSASRRRGLNLSRLRAGPACWSHAMGPDGRTAEGAIG